MEANLLYIILSIFTFSFLLSRVLAYLNLKSWNDKLPENLSTYYNEEEYAKSQTYHRQNEKLSFYNESINFVLIFAFLLFGIAGWTDNLLASVTGNEVLRGVLFFATLFIASEIINLPFGIYQTFVIEERFGFNKYTGKLFFVDKIKSYLLSLFIGGGLLYCVLWLIIEIGPSFWIYALLLIMTFSIVMNFLYTSLILPLFNKLTPLPDNELKEMIKSYAEKVKFPLKRIMVIDGSKRSTKANAFFSGFGKNKQIVLYDTLIEQHTNEELLGILAHEVGHYKKKHILLNIGISLFTTAIVFYIMSLMIFSPALSAALGSTSLSIHINLLGFGILYGPVSMFFGILANIVSRKHEYEADSFSVKTTGLFSQFKNALTKLSTKNLSNLHPHPAFVFVNYSHPPLKDRIKHIDRLEKHLNANAHE